MFPPTSLRFFAPGLALLLAAASGASSVAHAGDKPNPQAEKCAEQLDTSGESLEEFFKAQDDEARKKEGLSPEAEKRLHDEIAAVEAAAREKKRHEALALQQAREAQEAAANAASAREAAELEAKAEALAAEAQSAVPTEQAEFAPPKRIGLDPAEEIEQERQNVASKTAYAIPEVETSVIDVQLPMLSDLIGAGSNLSIVEAKIRVVLSGIRKHLDFDRRSQPYSQDWNKIILGEWPVFSDKTKSYHSWFKAIAAEKVDPEFRDFYSERFVFEREELGRVSTEDALRKLDKYEFQSTTAFVRELKAVKEKNRAEIVKKIGKKLLDLSPEDRPNITHSEMVDILKALPVAANGKDPQAEAYQQWRLLISTPWAMYPATSPIHQKIKEFDPALQKRIQEDHPELFGTPTKDSPVKGAGKPVLAGSKAKTKTAVVAEEDDLIVPQSKAKPKPKPPGTPIGLSTKGKKAIAWLFAGVLGVGGTVAVVQNLPHTDSNTDPITAQPKPAPWNAAPHATTQTVPVQVGQPNTMAEAIKVAEKIETSRRDEFLLSFAANHKVSVLDVVLAADTMQDAESKTKLANDYYNEHKLDLDLSDLDFYQCLDFAKYLSANDAQDAVYLKFAHNHMSPAQREKLVDKAHSPKIKTQIKQNK